MITKKEFNEKVEKLLRGDKAGVIDAVLKVCQQNLIEPESAKRLLSTPLKDRLKAEAQGLNLINRGKNSQGTLNSFFE
jgi:hypothetical protein